MRVSELEFINLMKRSDVFVPPRMYNIAIIYETIVVKYLIRIS